MSVDIGAATTLADAAAAAIKGAAVPSPFITPLTEDHLGSPSYTPAKLVDALLERFKLKNDAALSRVLELPPPVISKLRLKQASISAAVLIRMHDVTGMSITEMRELAGIKPVVKAL